MIIGSCILFLRVMTSLFHAVEADYIHYLTSWTLQEEIKIRMYLHSINAL